MVKLTGARADRFIARPDPGIQAVLLFGSDRGLVRERALKLAGTVTDDLQDAFRVVTLTGDTLSDDPARLADEAASMAFGGGRRVVMISGVSDKHGKLFAGFLDAPAGDALIVVEAGELTPRSSLRKAFEGAESGAAIGCYADDRAGLDRLIDEVLGGAGIGVDPGARSYLVEHLGSDRMVSRRELEKLVLYAGAARELTLEDCAAAIGDSGAHTLDDTIFAAADGDVAGLEQALDRSFLAAESPISLIRAMQRHLQRLQLAAAERSGGQPDDSVIGRMRVHFSRRSSMKRQLSIWSPDLVSQAIDIAMEAERDCKTTGMPDRTICRRALLRIALAARSRAGRRY
ncbi:DNA polymerase III subunit delta [Marinibaculum pumilum]|uniref:DNA-directed DNA polymerase n=1 Tax=Marinibaculum pumilum TaxID=1766165 RepID=A0ABV7KV14_9PROT